MRNPESDLSARLLRNPATEHRNGEMNEIGLGSGLAELGVIAARRVHFHDPDAPAATVVVPSVFVAVRNEPGELMLVRRCDSGTWELPGGRVDVGESAVDAAVRETSEESGIRVQITGLVGLFTDPACVVESVGGTEVRQQFVVCFRGWAMWGRPRPDLHETSDAAWFDPADVAALPVEPGARLLIVHALSGADEPHLG